MKHILPILLVVTSTAIAEENPIQDVVTRGTSFLSTNGPAFQKKKACITCHHGPITLWAEQEPVSFGFAKDRPSRGEFEQKLMTKFRKLSKSYDGRQWSHTLASFFVLSQPAEWKPGEHAEMTKLLTEAITRTQQKDGSWKAASQFTGQHRPAGEAAQLQTLWSVLAIARLEQENESLTTMREQAWKWIQKAKPPSSQDARAIRLLAEHRFGHSQERTSQLESILKDQNEDGSWGWTAGQKGDVWATGITLYVLSLMGEEVPKERLINAQSYLASTQKPDGSWHVPTKLKGKDHSDEMSSFFGTAWAVMGLTRSVR